MAVSRWVRLSFATVFVEHLERVLRNGQTYLISVQSSAAKNVYWQTVAWRVWRCLCRACLQCKKHLEAASQQAISVFSHTFL